MIRTHLLVEKFKNLYKKRLLESENSQDEIDIDTKVYDPSQFDDLVVSVPKEVYSLPLGVKIKDINGDIHEFETLNEAAACIYNGQVPYNENTTKIAGLKDRASQDELGTINSIRLSLFQCGVGWEKGRGSGPQLRRTACGELKVYFENPEELKEVDDVWYDIWKEFHKYKDDKSAAISDSYIRRISRKILVNNQNAKFLYYCQGYLEDIERLKRKEYKNIDNFADILNKANAKIDSIIESYTDPSKNSFVDEKFVDKILNYKIAFDDALKEIEKQRKEKMERFEDFERERNSEIQKMKNSLLRILSEEFPKNYISEENRDIMKQMLLSLNERGIKILNPQYNSKIRYSDLYGMPVSKRLLNSTYEESFELVSDIVNESFEKNKKISSFRNSFGNCSLASINGYINQAIKIELFLKEHSSFTRDEVIKLLWTLKSNSIRKY